MRTHDVYIQKWSKAAAENLYHARPKHLFRLLRIVGVNSASQQQQQNKWVAKCALYFRQNTMVKNSTYGCSVRDYVTQFALRFCCIWAPILCYIEVTLLGHWQSKLQEKLCTSNGINGWKRYIYYYATKHFLGVDVMIQCGCCGWQLGWSRMRTCVLYIDKGFILWWANRTLRCGNYVNCNDFISRTTRDLYIVE